MSAPAGLLRRYARDLVIEARRAGGEVVRRDLRHGARVSVRVVDGQITMSFSRPDVPVGEDELVTFIAHCEVPYGARRAPAEGQRLVDDRGRPRYVVAYTWPDNAPLEGFDV